MAVAPSIRTPSLVPGLDMGGRYSSRLSARSALFTDLRLLLDGGQAVEDAQTLRRLVLDENRLARPSARSRAKLWKELRARYLLDHGNPLFTAFAAEWILCTSERERALTAYVLLALNDRLVAELGIQWLFPLLRRAPTDLRVADVLAFFDRSARAHPEVAAWTQETRLAVAQKYVASVRDFGLATGKVRKRTLRPALYGAPTRLLIHGLQLSEAPSEAIIRAPSFRLLAIDEDEVADTLGELNRLGELSFRMQADVIELEAVPQR